MANCCANIEQREDESSRKPECRVQLTASILAAAIISNIVIPNVAPVSTIVSISFRQKQRLGKTNQSMDNPPSGEHKYGGRYTHSSA